MRPLLCLITLLTAAGAFAQTTSRSSLFTTVRPQVAISIREAKGGGDLVTISLVDPAYSGEVLSKQIGQMASYVNSAPRALRLYREDMGTSDPNGGLLKASFAIDGLIDGSTHTFHLTPVVKAMMGAPDPYRIDGMSVIFEGIAPNAQTLQRFSSDYVKLEANASPEIGIEYRVQLLTQDPSKLDIPEGKEKPEAAPPPAPAPKRVDWTLWITIAIAALATGALVYSLVLRAGSAARR